MQAKIISNQKSVESKDVTRAELIKEFSIHSRDLRPVFLLKQISTIITRDNCIIVNLDDIKCIIGKKKVYIFETGITEEIVEDFLVKLSEKNESKTPFEFIILETILQKRLQYLGKQFVSIEKKSSVLLSKLQTDSTDINLEKILSLKKSLSSFEIQVKEMKNTIYDLLEDDDELRSLRLSVKEEEKDMEEIESILENHYEQIEHIAHTISALNENIDDTQEIVTMKLSSIRNVIIRFDLMTNLITAILTVSAVITGLYGMNIVNHNEENPKAFLVISFGLVIFFLISFLGFWIYLKKRKILP